MKIKNISYFLPLLTLVILGSVGALALFETVMGNRNANQLPSVLIGKPAPEINLATLKQTLNDSPLDLSKFKGEPLLINFFASWCAPCRAEAPTLHKLSQQIKIVGIAYKDRDEDTLRFLKNYGNPYFLVGLDTDGKAGINWGVYGVPETYLLDPSGVVRFRHAGPLTQGIVESTLNPKIEALGS